MNVISLTTTRFGGEPVAVGIVVIAVSVILVYAMLWMVYVTVRYEASQWPLRWLDPRSYPAASWWDAMKDAISTRLEDRCDHDRIAVGSSPREIASSMQGYAVSEYLGRGDLCDVHCATSKRGSQRIVVKIPRETGFFAILEKEQMLLRQLQSHPQSNFYGAYFPVAGGTLGVGNDKVSTMQYRPGFDTAAYIRQSFPEGVPPRHVAWMFNRVLEALGLVHQLGWVHGAVLPPHLMFHADTHALQLIGWTHAVSIGQPLQIVSKRFKSWYPPACHQRQPATVATDIYLAAKTMLWMAGGDPDGTTLPDGFPSQMKRFLLECIYPRRASLDAWALHAQFRELLEDEFGPPEFCQLQLT